MQVWLPRVAAEVLQKNLSLLAAFFVHLVWAAAVSQTDAGKAQRSWKRHRKKAVKLLQFLEEPQFTSEHTPYADHSFWPGNATCWNQSDAAGHTLSFDRCCNVSREHTGNECWTRGVALGLSFDSCCGFASFPRSTLIQSSRRVVVALTSTPYRMTRLELTLQGLAHQTYPPDVIYLLLPLIFARDWSWYPMVPWWYSTSVGRTINIKRCEQDYRAQTAINCVLQHEPDPDTYIITVDDDVLYSPSFVELILAKSFQTPGAMIGVNSMAFGLYCRKFDAQGRCSLPNLAQGTYGKLFLRKWLIVAHIHTLSGQMQTGILTVVE